MTIDGLTERQVQLCDALWACDTLVEVEKMLSGLGTADRQAAETLMQIMVQDSLEEELAGMTRYKDAEKIFKKMS
jgi:hypothetical protein